MRKKYEVKKAVSVSIDQNGSAVLLVIALSVALGAAIGLASATSQGTHQLFVKDRAALSRNALASQVASYAVLPATFRSSVNPNLPTGTNPALANCIFGASATSCQAGEQPVNLYFPLNGSMKLLAGRGPVGSTGV